MGWEDEENKERKRKRKKKAKSKKNKFKEKDGEDGNPVNYRLSYVFCASFLFYYILSLYTVKLCVEIGEKYGK